MASRVRHFDSIARDDPFRNSGALLLWLAGDASALDILRAQEMAAFCRSHDQAKCRRTETSSQLVID